MCLIHNTINIYMFLTIFVLWAHLTDQHAMFLKMTIVVFGTLEMLILHENYWHLYFQWTCKKNGT